MVERKLRHKGRPFYGLAELEDGHAKISINPEIHKGGKERLNTLIHESLHIGDWLCGKERDLTEKEVNIISANIADILWRQGYRRCEIR